MIADTSQHTGGIHLDQNLLAVRAAQERPATWAAQEIFLAPPRFAPGLLRRTDLRGGKQAVLDELRRLRQAGKGAPGLPFDDGIARKTAFSGDLTVRCF